MQKGVITLLDVLGWKGIWQRQNGADAINKLKYLVDMIQTSIQRREHLYATTEGGFAEPFPKTRVISISDTIAIVSEINEHEREHYHIGRGPIESAIKYQSVLVARLIRESILAGIPLRGAMSVGEFEAADNILVGPAIDEVAEWYELCDWIGVIQSPSAYLLPDTWWYPFLEGELPDGLEDKPVLLYDDAPLVLYKAPSKIGPYLTRCINWPAEWFAPSPRRSSEGKGLSLIEDLTLVDLHEVILRMSPISPLVWKKYENTLLFYQKSFDAYSNKALISEFRTGNEVSRDMVRTSKGFSDIRQELKSDPKSYTLT
jgi:hypothetical protein